MSGNDDSKQPKSIVLHPVNFIDYMQQTLGVVNFQSDYDHVFMSADLFMGLISKVDKALRRNIIGKPNPVTHLGGKDSLDQNNVLKLKQIWYGHVYLYQRRDSQLNIIEHKIIYNPKTELGLGDEPLGELEELIRFPALMNMSPSSMIRDRKEVGIKIREMVQAKYAWWGFDHIQLTTMAKFTDSMPTETQAIFTSVEDIITSDLLVDYVSREYFNKVIKHLLIPFTDIADEIFLEMHEIIQEKFSGGMTEMMNTDDDEEDEMLM